MLHKTTTEHNETLQQHMFVQGQIALKTKLSCIKLTRAHLQFMLILCTNLHCNSLKTVKLFC